MIVTEHCPQHILSATNCTSLLRTFKSTIWGNPVCLFAKYLKNHLVDIDGNLRKQSLDEHLQLFNIWSQPDLRWPRQLITFSHHKNSNNSVDFTNIDLKLMWISLTTHIPTTTQNISVVIEWAWCYLQGWTQTTTAPPFLTHWHQRRWAMCVPSKQAGPLMLLFSIKHKWSLTLKRCLCTFSK